jgi:hypothetical protein
MMAFCATVAFCQAQDNTEQSEIFRLGNHSTISAVKFPRLCWCCAFEGGVDHQQNSIAITVGVVMAVRRVIVYQPSVLANIKHLFRLPIMHGKKLQL